MDIEVAHAALVVYSVRLKHKFYQFLSIACFLNTIYFCAVKNKINALYFDKQGDVACSVKKLPCTIPVK